MGAEMQQTANSRHSSFDWIITVSGIAALVIAIALNIVWPLAPGAGSPTWWIALVLWTLLLTASSGLTFDIAGAALSLTNLLAVSAVLTFGLPPALLMVASGEIAYQAAHELIRWQQTGRRPLRQALVVAATNVTLQVFSLLIGGLALYAVGGRVPLDDFSAAALTRLLALFIVYFLANNFLFSVQLKLEQGKPISASFWLDFHLVALFDLLPLPLGIVVAHIFSQLGLWSFIGLAVYLLGGMLMIHTLNQARLTAERRMTDLSILNEIGRALSSTLNLDELCETVHRQVSRIFDTTNFFIVTYEEGSDEWESVLHLEGGQRQARIRHKLGAGLTGYIIRHRAHVLLRSVAESKAFKAAHDIPQVGEQAKSWMGVPLIAAEKLVGVMAIQSYEHEGLYNEHDLGLFSIIAAQVAIAIQNARSFDEARRRLEQTRLLLRVSEAAASTLDSIEIMRRVAREATRALGADMAGAYLPDESGRRLRPVAGYHVPRELLDAFLAYRPALEGDAFAEEAYKHKRTVFSSDAVNDPRIDPEVKRFVSAQSVLLTPMIVKDTVVGGLWLLWWKEKHQFSGEEIQLVEGIVRQAAFAIDNARLLEEMRRRADEATGLSNIGLLLGSTRDMDEILQAIYDEASKVMDTAGFGLALYDEAKDEIQFELFIDQGKRLDKFGGPASSAPLNAWIVRNKQSIFVRDPAHDTFPVKETVTVGGDWLPKSFVGVPLVYKGRAIGAITVQSEKPFAFDLHQKQMLESIAHMAAPALENARLVRQLTEAIESQSQLLETIRELGAPLIPLAEGIVVLPLIGHIDPQRAQSIMESLLTGIATHQAEVVLMDITGVATVDTGVANSLLQAAQAARLLGAHVILVGVRPEVAHTLVNLGIELKGISTFASLQTGIEAALAMRGFAITPLPRKT